MDARTSFRGAKTSKIGKKGVFVMVTNFGKIKKKHAKHVFRVFFHVCKISVEVCFESPFTRMKSNLKYKWPPSPANISLKPSDSLIFT